MAELRPSRWEAFSDSQVSPTQSEMDTGGGTLPCAREGRGPGKARPCSARKGPEGMRPCLGFRPPGVRGGDLCCFKPLGIWCFVIVSTGLRNNNPKIIYLSVK